MKRNKTSTANWFQQKLKPLPALAGTGAIAVFPVSKKRRSYAPRPHFEKIGGMDKKVRIFVNQHCNINYGEVSVVRTSVKESIQHLPNGIKNIVNLKRINDVKDINAFLAKVNQTIPEGGLFISCVETKYSRKQRILRKFPPLFNYLFLVIDFVYKRVLPKLPVTRKVYSWVSGDRNKVLSRTETYGRLYAAGFEVIDQKVIGHDLYFAAVKKKASMFSKERPYGPIFCMRRIGKNGKIIKVYKMRTMHAYSEFIQEYVYNNNKLADGGKLKDDFRVSTLGKLFRKYWIDELPMIYNLLKGDIKLVGVRPLSSHYLSLYDEALQQKRLTHKPGLIPPFYADMPKTLEEIQMSELRYLEAYEKNGFATDLKYFWKIFFNIVFRKARSK